MQTLIGRQALFFLEEDKYVRENVSLYTSLERNLAHKLVRPTFSLAVVVSLVDTYCPLPIQL